MARALRAVVVLGAFVIVAVGIRTLSRATMSTHEAVAPHSQIELIVDARTRNGSTSAALTDMVTAQVLSCRLEVSSDPVGAVEPIAEDGDHVRYRAVLAPSMDRTDRRQFRGCLQDWVIDRVQVRVVRLAPT